MELLGTLSDGEYAIHIEQNEHGQYLVDIEGRRYTLDCLELMPNVFSMLNGNHSHEVRLHQGEGGRIDTHFYKNSYELEMADPMKKILENSMGASAGAAELRAPMPGQVQRVLVSEGDSVEMDQGLVVLVAMKMENALTSPKSGKVEKILVAEGDDVEGNAPMIIIA